MTTGAFFESGMKFGPYPTDCCFRIEQSETYAAIKDGVKIAEFLLLRNSGGSLWIVEAKSSSPNMGAESDSVDSSAYIEGIREKLVNSLSLGFALTLGRHPKTRKELPEPFMKIDLPKIQVRFVLVIKNSEADWLPPIQEMMNKAMRPTIKTWDLGPNSVIVLNEAGAKERGLIK